MAGSVSSSGHEMSHNLRRICEEVRENVDMAKLRGLHYLPKTKFMWQGQYIYQPQDSEGNMVPLNAEQIDELILQPVVGKDPLLHKKFIKKSVVLGDTIFLEEFLEPFLIRSKAGTFLDIFPHTYIVPVNDPIVSQSSIGFIEIINKSQPSFTISGLLSDSDLFWELLQIQPDCININIGIADIKLENISWSFESIPKEFVNKVDELIAHFHAYFLRAGPRGVFAEKLITTFNLLPMYSAAHSQRHNKQNQHQAVQHTNLWGTTYYNVTREEYKILADLINKKLHKSTESYFNKYQMVLINPTPKWEFEDLHVDRHSGLPSKDMHLELLGIFFHVIARVFCTRPICTLGMGASRKSRKVDEQLHEGCNILYKKLMEEGNINETQYHPVFNEI